MPDLTTPAGRDELRREIKKDLVDFPKSNVRIVTTRLLFTDLLALLDQADAGDKLQRFKDWVHAYLDAKGIPHHPPGTHGAEGCRIGDRMDYVFAKIDLGAALAQRVIRAARLLGIANSDTEPNAAETQMLVDDILTHCANLADAGEREWQSIKALQDAYAHHQLALSRHDSPFISENGRHGKSPWAELMDAVEAVVATLPPPPARAATEDK